VPSFPVFLKEWQEPIVATLPQQSTAAIQHGEAVVAVANALKSPPLNPLTVVACSDAVTAGATYTWVDNSDIVASTSSNRSWIVMGHPSGMQFCIAFDQANNQSATCKFSMAAGFTGGTVSARPTATDEVGLAAANNWFCGANFGRCKLILLHSTDGKVTYLFIMRQGIILSAWLMGEAMPQHGSWSPATFGTIEGSNSLASSQLNDGIRFNTLDRIAAYAASGQMFLRTTSHASTHTRMELKQPYREALSGKWPVWSMGLACVNSPRRGKHGRLPDFFRIPTGIPPGWIFPSDDGERALMAIGIGYAIPWRQVIQPAVL